MTHEELWEARWVIVTVLFGAVYISVAIVLWVRRLRQERRIRQELDRPRPRDGTLAREAAEQLGLVDIWCECIEDELLQEYLGLSIPGCLRLDDALAFEALDESLSSRDRRLKEFGETLTKAIAETHERLGEKPPPPPRTVADVFTSCNALLVKHGDKEDDPFLTCS